MNLAEATDEMKRTCAVPDCDAERYCRGWCTKHYQRWRKHGDPLATKIPELDLSLAERLWRDVDVIRWGCWEWTGSTTSEGYGHFRHGGAKRLTHRVAYELLVGPIPEGLQLDHLCRNTRCCNPSHLEPVTRKVNILRGTSPTARNARKTHCVNGHELTGANVYRRPGGRGRGCVACQRQAVREWRARQK